MNKIKLKDFLEFKAISQIEASPNNQKYAFVLSSINEKDNSADRVIYISENNQYKQMTSLKKESNYEWQDDNHLLFATKRFKKEEDQTDSTFIYRIALDGGEAQCAYEINIPVNQFKVLDENRLLLLSPFHSDHPNFYSYSKSKREKITKEKKESDYFTELNQIPYWFNGTQYIDSMKTRLFLYEIDSNKLTPLTTPSMDVEQLFMNKNKDKVYYTYSTYKTKAPLKNKLNQLDLNNLESTQIISTNRFSISTVFSLEDGLYMLASEGKRLGLNQNPALYKVNDPNETELLFDDLYYGNSIGTDVRLGGNSQVYLDYNSFIFNTTVDGHSELIEFKDGQLNTLFNQEGSVDGFTKVNNQLVLMGLFNQQVHDFYDQDLNRLSHFNTQLDDKNVIKPEKITFESNGSEISGWVLVPHHTDKPLHAILDIHGGPRTAYGEVYYHEMQVWANMGYLVMYCNPHGSSGKGDQFSDIRGKYGTIDYEDIMTFVDKVVEKYPQIDKIGVTGGSYGGFMTNWIIGHTNRFACAATQRSISNWTSFYGVSDIGYYFTEDQNNADIYSQKGQEKLWWHSPLKYAAQFSTPTLVVHSTDDYRCPIDQGYQLFTALLDRRVEAKMVILKGENHDLSRSGKPKARIKRLTEITNWFKKYL